MVLLDCLQLPNQSVVLRVADLRLVQHVILMFMMLDLATQEFGV